jgi:branched-chain amino acid transport system substrate-binding protein
MVANRFRILIVLAVLALAAAACGSDDADSAGDDGASQGGGATEASGEPLVIGYAAALTGDGAAGDVPGLQGVEYAVDQLNDAGGIDGHPVELVTKDMQSDPALGGRVTQELLDEGAQVILGPPFPAMAVGVIQTAGKADVPVLSVTSTQPEYPVVGGSPAFLAAFGDNVQAAAAAQYALAQGFKTSFTMVSPDFSYTEENPEFFVETFTNGGGENIGSETFSIGQEDFSTQVTAIANLPEQPDVIFGALFMPDLGTFLKQLREAGVDTPVYGVDGFDTQAVIDFAGGDAENVVFATHGFPEEGSSFAEFVSAVEEAQGEAPEAPALTALGGDAIAIVKAAVEQAGSVEPAAIGEAMSQLDALQVVTGELSYAGGNGIPRKTVSMVAIESGEFVLKDQFVPEFIPEP